MVKDYIMKDITYTWGIGGYDPSKPNNNLVEIKEIEIPDEEEQNENKENG